MHSTRTSARAPVGPSFEVAELLLIQAWSEFHDLRIVIDLDYSVDGDDYEEVVSFYQEGHVLRRWMMWRDRQECMVQPLSGPALRFRHVVDALEVLMQPAGQA